MHTRDARSAGESEARLYLLDAWRETDIYTRRERAALAWTEAITLVGDGHPSDELYNEARVVFDESELVVLTAAIGMINLWNRMSIAFRAMPQVRNSRHTVAP
jgi:alkylhydroperoxidase family enzyme